MKLKDEEWKAKIIALFNGEIEVYDDKEENLRYFSKIFKNVKYYLVKDHRS
ncbi:hypothetical protein [Candidatus Acidianus copahuensis]|uniref:hypothetical protein n=1 Tax=Candidatus Acidianus copahuensis TaxID=1160895 RepID=UPI00135F191D|nr:hypothetical protein [Candidatus Acidianus copahuensis]